MAWANVTQGVARWHCCIPMYVPQQYLGNEATTNIW